MTSKTRTILAENVILTRTHLGLGGWRGGALWSTCSASVDLLLGGKQGVCGRPVVYTETERIGGVAPDRQVSSLEYAASPPFQVGDQTVTLLLREHHS